MLEISNCAFWSVGPVGRPDTAGRRPPWTGCALHVTGRRWGRMWAHLSTIASTRGRGKIPRPFGETTHGTEENSCLRFDYLYIQIPPESDDNTKYILVLEQDITGFVMLEHASASNAENAAAGLQRWCTTPGIPSVLVSDTATHFKNHLLAKLTTLLGVENRFAVAKSPWSNGAVENVMKEVLRVLKV
ncbi:unnamed protein product [Laminaria digitata]